MIEKNQIISAVTDALSSNGEGIIRHEGVTFSCLIVCRERKSRSGY